jgi:hypothetical protein
MITVRQIERLWTAKSFGKLYKDLVACRPEAAFTLETEPASLAAASAIAMIRLEELSQSYLPFYSRLLRTILTAQEADGGWGDVATTALCVRALLCEDGDGIAIERGLAYLENLQKPEGIWPAVPLRRMPEDARVSLFVLYHLGEKDRFRAATRFDDAMEWFDAHGSSLDIGCRALWDRVKLKCRRSVSHAAPVPAGLFAA